MNGGGECRNIGLGDRRGYSDVVCGGASPVRLLCCTELIILLQLRWASPPVAIATQGRTNHEESDKEQKDGG